MLEREICVRPSGRVDIYEANGGVSYESVREARINLNLRESRARNSCIALISLAAYAGNLGKRDLIAGFRQKDKIKFSKGVTKIGTAGALCVIGGILGVVSNTAGNRLEDLNKAA